MQREKLAIYNHKDEIIKTVSGSQVVVVEAPTGSGKTTQIPQILFNSGLLTYGLIGVTQPRRIAAFGVSSRIAEEMGVELGRLVGYKVRFDDFTSENTQIKIMTDGILLEEMRSDPLLTRYSIIMVDEAHERTLNIDFILGLLKEILRLRPDFKVLVSSATINPKLFSEYFNNAPIISVQTKPYPIDVKYYPIKRQNDYELLIQRVVDIAYNLEKNNIEGDILIFMDGEGAIKDCCQRLAALNFSHHTNFEILPLYARLSPEEQKRVFLDFPGKRKVVIATNIAETSITIDGIIHVIDSGLSKLNYYHPRTFTSFLESKPISKASCNQRMGRAGRTAPGIVYRLYSEGDYENRDEYTLEEIYRTDLSEVVLRMADLGISHYTEFDFISPPKKGAIFSAIETLVLIDALDSKENLTDIGKKMVDFPLGPRLSRILIEAVLKYRNVTDFILIIISFLSAKNPFLYPQGEEIESRNAQKLLMAEGGDFFTWINLFYKFKKIKDQEKFCADYYLDIRSMNEIVNIHNQLKDMLLDRNYRIISNFNYDDIISCLCTGLKQYICRKDQKKKNTYYSATENDIRIHPGSFLFGESPLWLVGGEIVNTGRTYVRTSAIVKENLINSKFKDVYEQITKRLAKKGKMLVSKGAVKKKIEVFSDNKIYLFDKYFEIREENRTDYAIIPYHIIIQLKDRKEKLIKHDYGRLKAKLTFNEKIILIDRLNSLLKYFDKIDLDNGINVKWPKNQVLIYPDDWFTIFKYLRIILRPTTSKKTSRQAGFLALTNTDQNSYQFYLERDFFTAIEVSIDSLENLFMSDIQAWNDKEKVIVEAVHHKLLSLSEEMEV
ncbi:MAG: ATP-dependent RNA helicase [Spirochaetes bacterium]|nr:ATP-dependent RNA helicase [Spirochaetota bacterium]